ncbi:tetratricopeptide repeat protein [Maritalea porphyrae]|uniref:tetratricopeptide repeat protein n=1 Tax=Maritalea porphyrae TaxID=880732 RepID=UPI0022AEA3A4|nr:hypothetical protein [Maritalea porphyrae]MCZ4272677.1 hypothetical protein [Maritalea porphyrae]
MKFIEKFNSSIRHLNKTDAFAFVDACAEQGDFPPERLGVYRFYVANRFDDYELARQIEQEYHKTYPDQFRRRYLSGGVAIALGNYVEAENHFLKLINYEEETGKFFSIDNALLFLAYIYKIRGDHELVKSTIGRIGDKTVSTWGTGDIPDLSLRDIAEYD